MGRTFPRHNHAEFLLAHGVFCLAWTLVYWLSVNSVQSKVVLIRVCGQLFISNRGHRCVTPYSCDTAFLYWGLWRFMLQLEISQLLGFIDAFRSVVTNPLCWIHNLGHVLWSKFNRPRACFCYLDSFTPSLSIRISGHMNLVINLPSCVFPARSHERVGHYRSKRGVLRIIWLFFHLKWSIWGPHTLEPLWNGNYQ